MENGFLVAKDLKQAIFWYEKAVEQNYAQAQNNLGACYHYGRGVEQDEDHAMQLLQAAADQDLEVAKATLRAVNEWKQQQDEAAKHQAACTCDSGEKKTGKKWRWKKK
jgi:hypothetical protein